MDPHASTDRTQPKTNGKPSTSGSGPDIQDRLRALVEAEEGTLKQQRAEAERRLAEAQALLAEARADVGRERDRSAELESTLEERARDQRSAEEKLAEIQGEAEVLRSQLTQASA